MKVQEKINAASTKEDSKKTSMLSNSQKPGKSKDYQSLIDYTAIIKNKMASLGLKHERVIESQEIYLREAENRPKSRNIYHSSGLHGSRQTVIDIRSILNDSLKKPVMYQKKYPIPIIIDREKQKYAKEIKRYKVVLGSFNSNIQLLYMLKSAKNKDIEMSSPDIDRFLYNYGWWLPNPQKEQMFSELLEKNNVFGLRYFYKLKESLDIPQSFFYSVLRFLGEKLKINEISALSLLKIHLQHNPRLFTLEEPVGTNGHIIKLNENIFKDVYSDCKVKQNSALFLATTDILTKIYRKYCSCYVPIMKLLFEREYFTKNQMKVIALQAFSAFRQRLDRIVKSNKKSQYILDDREIVKGAISILLMAAYKSCDVMLPETMTGFFYRFDSCVEILGDSKELSRLAYIFIRLPEVLLFWKGIKVEKDKIYTSILPFLRKIKYRPIQLIIQPIEAYYMKNVPIFRNIEDLLELEGCNFLEWLYFWCFGKTFSHSGELKYAYDICCNALSYAADFFCKEINNQTFHNIKIFFKKLNELNYIEQLLHIVKLLAGTVDKPRAEIVMNNISYIVCHGGGKNAGIAFLRYIIKQNYKYPVLESALNSLFSKIIEVEPWLMLRLDYILGVSSFSRLLNHITSDTIAAFHALLKHNPYRFYGMLSYHKKTKGTLYHDIIVDHKLIYYHIIRVIQNRPYESPKIEKYLYDLFKILARQQTVESEVVLLDLLLSNQQLMLGILGSTNGRIFNKLYENTIQNICSESKNDDDTWMTMKCLNIIDKCMKYVPLSSDSGMLAVQLNDVVAVLMTSIETSLVGVGPDNILVKMMACYDAVIAVMACKIFLKAQYSFKDYKNKTESPELLVFLNKNLSRHKDLCLRLLATISIHQPVIFSNILKHIDLYKMLETELTVGVLVPLITILMDYRVKNTLIRIFTAEIVYRVLKVPEDTHKNQLLYISLIFYLFSVLYRANKYPYVRNLQKVFGNQIFKILFKNRENYDYRLLEYHDGLWIQKEYVKKLYETEDISDLVANSLAYCSWCRLLLHTIHEGKAQELERLAAALIEMLNSSAITYTEPVFLLLANILKKTKNYKLAQQLGEHPYCLATRNKLVVSVDTRGKRLLTLIVGWILKKMPEKWQLPIQHTLEDMRGIDLFCLVEHKMNPKDITYLAMKYLQITYDGLNHYHFAIICSHVIRHLDRSDVDSQKRFLGMAYKMMQYVDVTALPAYIQAYRNPYHIIWCWLLLLVANILVMPGMTVDYLIGTLSSRLRVIQRREHTIANIEEINCIFQCLNAIELYTNSYETVEAIEIFQERCRSIIFYGRFEAVSSMYLFMARGNRTLSMYEVYCRLASLELCRNLCLFLRLVLRRDTTYLDELANTYIAYMNKVILQMLGYLSYSDRLIGKEAAKEQYAAINGAFYDFNTVIDKQQVGYMLGLLNLPYIKSVRKHTNYIISEDYNELCQAIIAQLKNMHDSKPLYKENSVSAFYRQLSNFLDGIRENVDEDVFRELRKFHGC